MLALNKKKVEVNKFPDGTFRFEKINGVEYGLNTIVWNYEKEEELVQLMYLTMHLKNNNCNQIQLVLPYVPNARMDRTKDSEEVFTLKYFCEIINSLGFKKVIITEPHSYVTPALIDKVEILDYKNFITRLYEALKRQFTKDNLDIDNLMFFFPDEGARKRYSIFAIGEHAYGEKDRDWSTGKINGLILHGADVKDKNIVIIDDICSRGGTFYHSAKALKEAGANKIYLYVTHCENTILEGEVLTSGLIEKVFTTGSIFTKEHDKVEIIDDVFGTIFTKES